MNLLTAFKKWVTCEEATRTYESPYVCGVCGHTSTITLLKNPHPAIMSLELMQMVRGPLCMTKITYGDFNKRNMWVCSVHKDSEIKDKIKELV